MISSLVLLLYSRYLINGNFAYPLLTNIFNNNDYLIDNFAIYLKNYGRSAMFPLNIFFPFNISSLSITLGFPISLIIFYVFFIKIKNYKKFFHNPILNVFFVQIILLICFCQGRGYYYLSPIILVISQLNYFSFAIVKLSKIF